MRDMHQPITENELDSLGDSGLYHDGGIIDGQTITTALYDGPSGLDQIMESFDYEGIGKENLRGTDIENASSSEDDDDDDDDYFSPNAFTHSRGRIDTNECYICGSKMYEGISMGSTLCDGCKMSINKRKRRITI